MEFFTALGIGCIVFIFVRAAWYLLVQVPRGHAKDEAICEKCFGKRRSDDVTEQMEWCHCPQKEDGSDRHFKHYHNECPDCQAGVGCTVCNICAPWFDHEEKK